MFDGGASGKFQVVSLDVWVNITLICACRQGVLVLRSMGEVAVCPHCRQEYGVDRMDFDRVAAFRDHAQEVKAAAVNVASRTPLIVVPKDAIPQ